MDMTNSDLGLPPCEAVNAMQRTLLRLQANLGLLPIILPWLFALPCLWISTVSQSGEPNDVLLGLPRQQPALQKEHVDPLAALGRRIFFDRNLSADRTISCATCHIPQNALADGLPVSRGTANQSGARNAPSLINVRFNESLFWDGRRTKLEEQALDPLLNPLEHGLNDTENLLIRIGNDPVYVASFQQLFDAVPNPVQPTHIGMALASFERTLNAAGSPFDRYYIGGDKTALPENAIRGLELFRGRAKCDSCHTIKNDHALFSDGQFHRLSAGSGNSSQSLATVTTRLVDARRSGRSLDHTILNDPDIAELGRFVVTLDPNDIGKFRTPSLRNVSVTGPYMHNGQIKTLEEAVELEIYYRGVENGFPLILTLQERADLIAFLISLTSPYINQLATQ